MGSTLLYVLLILSINEQTNSWTGTSEVRDKLLSLNSPQNLMVTMSSATTKFPIRYRQSSEYFSQQQWQQQFQALVLYMKLCVQEQPAALLQPSFDALMPTKQCVCFCTTDCHHQHRLEADVFHSISICPGLLRSF